MKVEIPQQDQSEFLREFLAGIVPEEEIEKRILKHQKERYRPSPRSIRDNVPRSKAAGNNVPPAPKPIRIGTSSRTRKAPITFEKFIADNYLQNLYQDEQRDVYKEYVEILDILQTNPKTNKKVHIGRMSQHEIIALGIALRHFSLHYQGKLLLKTRSENEAVNYIHVNPDTINHLLNLLEGDEVRDSVQGFGWSMLHNIGVEVLFDTEQNISKQSKKKSG